MAGNAIMNNVYYHYLTAYAPKNMVSKNNASHKKNETRSVYNSIVKLSTESPLYIMDTSKEAQKFAINIKEGARNFQNTIMSLGGIEEDGMLNKKTAFSSDNNILTAKYIGNASSSNVPSYEIEVHALAQPQTNLGYFLPSEKHSMENGTYSFDLAINDLNYEFQYNVSDTDTNKEVQERLARLVTNANIGIKAEVIENGEGYSALQLQSNMAGLPEGKSFLFHVSDDKTSKTAGSVKTFGIGEVTTPASNAEFTVNGNSRSALSNRFTLEKTYELELLSVSDDSHPVTVGLKTNTESLAESIGHMVGSYNNFLRSAAEYLESQPNSRRLIQEMRSVASLHSNHLEPLGLSLQVDGYIDLDNGLLTQSMTENNTSEFFSSMKDFTNSILAKTKEVSLNPMDYVNRKIVAYKNPGHNFTNPYVTSAYSGMMFNSYC